MALDVDNFKFLYNFLIYTRANPILLLSIILAAGLIGGEISRVSPFLPRIFGYILVGIFIGPNGLNIIDIATLNKSRLFIDIPLSIILFELGKNLDFNWLKHNKNLLKISIAEITLTFGFVFCTLYFFLNFALLSSALGATIAIATSAAVILMITYDLESEGPVTRRLLILTSMNNFAAIAIFTILSTLMTSLNSPHHIQNTIGNIMYDLLGSIILGLLVFLLLTQIAKFIGKHKSNQFLLVFSIVLLTLGLAHELKLSAMLALFSLGVSARNFDVNHCLLNTDFSWWTRVFFVLLLVMTGAYLQFRELGLATGAILIFIIVRCASKLLGVWLFSKSERLTKTQTVGLGLSLFPMAGVAIGISVKILDFNPNLGYFLFTVISGVIAISNIIGPIVTQFALINTEEAASYYTLKNQELKNE